jgi:integrase
MAKRKDRDGVEIKKVVTLANGTKKPMSFYGATKQKAIKKYEQFLIEQSKEEQKKTIAYFSDVADDWLTTKDGAVQPATYAGYKYKVEAMKVQWDDVLVDEIRDADIKRYINKLSKDQSENTVKKVIIYLNAIFEFAISNELLTRNPMKEVKLPATARKPKKPNHYTTEQERRVLDHAKEMGIDGLTVFIPLKTGARPGEAIALKPERDIDPVNKTLHIQETVKKASPKKTGKTKTETSDRIIPVDDEFLDHIGSFDFKGYIFDNGNGQPKNYNNWYNKNYTRVVSSLPADIPRLIPHEMRHTHGTLLYERGTDLYTIMKVMGHSDIKVTQIYVHHSVELMRDKIKR